MAEMFTTVQSLKGLYVKLGGNAADVAEVSTETEMIQKITDVASSGGGGGAKLVALNEYVGISDGAAVFADMQAGADYKFYFEQSETTFYFIPISFGASGNTNKINMYGINLTNPTTYKVSTWSYVQETDTFDAPTS